MIFSQTEVRSRGPLFARCKRVNRRKCMWAYLIGLGVLALILVTSHLPRSGFNPTTFVDNYDPVESGESCFTTAIKSRLLNLTISNLNGITNQIIIDAIET